LKNALMEKIKENHKDRIFRANVAGILQDGKGRILICERVDTTGAWQFPQGGIDEGETPEQALARELCEEISVTAADYKVLDRKGPYRYEYAEGRLVKGCHGKVQHYFLVRFDAPVSRINVETDHPEFRDTRWILPSEFKLSWLPEMKREVYREVFSDFFEVAL